MIVVLVVKSIKIMLKKVLDLPFSELQVINLQKILLKVKQQYPSQDEGFSFRIGLAGDRPSAYRMVDTLLYANPTTINIDAMVGYLNEITKKFLIIHPMVSDRKAVKKLKRLAMKRGDKDIRYSPELLSKSLLRSKYCEVNPSDCDTSMEVDAVEDDDQDVDMIKDSPTSVSDVRNLESNEIHRRENGVLKVN